MINNNITISDKSQNAKIIEVEQYERNYTYSKMHEAIISNDFEIICSFKEGEEVIDVINGIIPLTK